MGIVECQKEKAIQYAINVKEVCKKSFKGTYGVSAGVSARLVKKKLISSVAIDNIV